MTASVSTDKTDSVLSYLCEKWDLGAASHKDIARVMSGQVLPDWEPCSEINPNAPRISVIRTAPRVAVGDLQQTSATVSNSQIDVSQGFEKASSTPGEEALNKQRSDANGNSIFKNALTSTALPAIANTDNTLAASPPTAIAPETLEQIQAIKQIAEANNQNGAAEKNIAKLLHQGGLATEILNGEDFYLKVENKPFTPLSIERHGQELYLTHFLKDNYGDLFLDAEMVFNISNQGQLSLTQTATQNPFNGGEYRSNDRGFGQTFSSNLLAQGFATATLSAFQQKQQSQSQQSQHTPEVIAPDSNTSAILVSDHQPPAHLLLTTDNSKEQETSIKVEASPSEPLFSSSVNRTKESSKKSSATSKSTQVIEPQGLQLSLFDVGLNVNPTTEVKNIPQSPAQEVKSKPATSRRVEEVVPNNWSLDYPSQRDPALLRR